MERERRPLPQQQVAGRSQDLRGRGSGGSCQRDGCERHEKDAGEQERQTPHRRAQRRRRVTDVEGRATRPKQGCAPCGQYGLFEVEPLDEVEDGEGGHETERKPKRPRAAPIEVVGGNEECNRHRHRERVGRTHHRERLDVHEQMAAPRNVRRHRRNEVDDRDHGDHERGDHRYIVELLRRSKSQWLSVEAEPPGSRVACALREVRPVLRDEPDADECHFESGEHAERLQQHGDSVAGQDGQAEVPLVDPQTQDIDARSKPVPLDLQHQDRPHPQAAGRNSLPKPEWANRPPAAEREASRHR